VLGASDIIFILCVVVFVVASLGLVTPRCPKGVVMNLHRDRADLKIELTDPIIHATNMTRDLDCPVLDEGHHLRTERRQLFPLLAVEQSHVEAQITSLRRANHDFTKRPEAAGSGTPGRAKLAKQASASKTALVLHRREVLLPEK